MLNIGNCNVSPAACQHPRQDNLIQVRRQPTEKISFFCDTGFLFADFKTRGSFINKSIQPPFLLFIFTTTA
jgi:hypothetical protein